MVSAPWVSRVGGAYVTLLGHSIDLDRLQPRIDHPVTENKSVSFSSFSSIQSLDRFFRSSYAKDSSLENGHEKRPKKP